MKKNSPHPILVFLGGVSLLVLWSLLAASATAQPPDLDRLLNGVDDLTRGDSSRGSMRMTVKTKRWTREIAMKVASQGQEKTLVEITSPARERGTATLKVGQDIWNYLPKVDRTIRVPASMMSAGWMGSHITNDDLVRAVRFADDYDCTYDLQPQVNDGNYRIACVPHEDAPVVWGKVELEIAASDELIRATRFFGEDGALRRTMTYSDIRDFGGRRLPRQTRVEPADGSGEYTEIVYEELEFDVDLPPRTFTLQALKR